MERGNENARIHEHMGGLLHPIHVPASPAKRSACWEQLPDGRGRWLVVWRDGSEVRIILGLLLCLWSSTAFGVDVAIKWDPNKESFLAGYRIYYGTESRVYPHSIDVGNQTTCTIVGLTATGKYFIAATAYDIYGNESDYSGELPIRILVDGVVQDLRKLRWLQHSVIGQSLSVR